MRGDGWQPQPPLRGNYDWPDIAKRLKARPGQWLLIAEQVPRTVHGAVVRGRIQALRDPRWVFECKTRNTNGKNADIWMSARHREEGETACLSRE